MLTPIDRKKKSRRAIMAGLNSFLGVGDISLEFLRQIIYT
jgi:hypothetical protein